jgi:peptidoglycan/LPS O-acetylase OafA/YrhL
MSIPASLKYRKEIDGLRALAVVPVILFHAGFDHFSGGFVGVDVFFVISGYLITTIILAEKEEGTFRLINFYERRIRRILPALFLVMIACIPPAWFWLMPEKLEYFGESMMAVILFLSNFLFWRKSDYFGPAADETPFLHTWSLAVEEQFYVFYPPLIMMCWFLGHRRLGFLIVAAAVTSLGLSEWAWRQQPSANFYLGPTRAWELMIGATVAFAAFGRPDGAMGGPRLRQAASALGLAMILYPIFFFDSSTPVPGLPALLPTVGTALIIAFAGPATFAGRLLALPPMVGIGLISYSAYLWHQPLFAFARIRSPNELGLATFGLLSLAALALAYLSWRFVEKPFRDKRSVSRNTIFKSAAVASLVLFTVGFAFDQSKGAGFRYTTEQKQVLDLLKYPLRAKYYRDGNCHLAEDKPYQKNCYADLIDKNNAVLVWGDSHAAALHVGVFEALGSAPHAQLTSPGCPPLFGYEATDRGYCGPTGRRVGEILAQSRSPVILMHANWRRYGKDPRLYPMLEKTIADLKAAGKRVVVVGSLPQWRPSLPEVLAGRMFQHDLTLSALPRMIPSNRYNELRELDHSLKAIADRQGVPMLSLLDILCEKNQCRALLDTPEGLKLTAWDYGHLTYEGSLHVGGRLVDMLAKAVPGVTPAPAATGDRK